MVSAEQNQTKLPTIRSTLTFPSTMAAFCSTLVQAQKEYSPCAGLPWTCPPKNPTMHKLAMRKLSGSIMLSRCIIETFVIWGCISFLLSTHLFAAAWPQEPKDFMGLRWNSSPQELDDHQKIVAAGRCVD